MYEKQPYKPWNGKLLLAAVKEDRSNTCFRIHLCWLQLCSVIARTICYTDRRHYRHNHAHLLPILHLQLRSLVTDLCCRYSQVSVSNFATSFCIARYPSALRQCASFLFLFIYHFHFSVAYETTTTTISTWRREDVLLIITILVGELGVLDFFFRRVRRIGSVLFVCM